MKATTKLYSLWIVSSKIHHPPLPLPRNLQNYSLSHRVEPNHQIIRIERKQDCVFIIQWILCESVEVYSCSHIVNPLLLGPSHFCSQKAADLWIAVDIHMCRLLFRCAYGDHCVCIVHKRKKRDKRFVRFTKSCRLSVIPGARFGYSNERLPNTHSVDIVVLAALWLLSLICYSMGTLSYIMCDVKVVWLLVGLLAQSLYILAHNFERLVGLSGIRIINFIIILKKRFKGQ